MIELPTFIEMIRDDLGLPLTVDTLDRPFDDLPTWDSVYLLKLLGSVEAATGRRVSVPALLRAHTLREVYDVVSLP